MTLQYIAGELSLILGELEAAVPTRAARRQVADLRHEAETAPFPILPPSRPGRCSSPTTPAGHR
jgi:hypothetical protein